MIQIERGEGFADWRFLRADRSFAYLHRLSSAELNGLLYSDALFDLLSGTERAWDQLQSGLEAQLGVTVAHRFDPHSSTLTVRRESGAEFTVPAIPLGTYSREEFAWLWGWADPSLPEESTGRLLALCAPDARQPGLAALWKELFHCDEGFAWALAAHACVALACRGIYRAEDSTRLKSTLFALKELPE